MESIQRNVILNDCSTLCRKHNGPREVGFGKQEPDPDPFVRGKEPRIRGSDLICHGSGTLLVSKSDENLST
jgi:hypothetical protein